MDTLQKFYKSKEWESFRQVIIAERTKDDGYVYCEHCGKPILKPYDTIVHHKEELTEVNVNDYKIALNPENMMVVHFRCHNEIHERFGFNKTGGGSTYRPKQKKVYIVYGSPCSGKSKWVRENATENDIVVDIDSIYECISINERYKKPDRIKSVVFEMRDKMYDIIKYRSGKWNDAFIITGGALLGDRERLMQRVGADEMIFIDTPMGECLARAKEKRSDEWYEYVLKWFETFQPEND